MSSSSSAYSLQAIVSIDVSEYASVNSDDGEDDAEQRNSGEFVDKLHSNVHNAA